MAQYDLIIRGGTIVDGTGLMIYFLIAHATLPQLAGL